MALAVYTVVIVWQTRRIIIFTKNRHQKRNYKQSESGGGGAAVWWTNRFRTRLIKCEGGSLQASFKGFYIGNFQIIWKFRASMCMYKLILVCKPWYRNPYKNITCITTSKTYAQAHPCKQSLTFHEFFLNFA